MQVTCLHCSSYDETFVSQEVLALKGLQLPQRFTAELAVRSLPPVLVFWNQRKTQLEFPIRSYPASRVLPGV